MRDGNLMLRIRFSKYGAMKYIGHLDVMRYFQKLNRRAGIDTAYSEGFSPHQIMSFAQPLGVGLESRGEYMDLEVCSAPSSQAVKEALNAVQAEGIYVTDVVRLPDRAENAMASVCQASYTVRFREGKEPGFSLEETVREFLRRESVPVVKATKKGSREIDLKELVQELRVPEENVLFMKLTASSGNNVKPALVVNTLCEMQGAAPPDNIDLLITREDLFDREGRTLLEAGEYF